MFRAREPVDRLGLREATIADTNGDGVAMRVDLTFSNGGFDGLIFNADSLRVIFGEYVTLTAETSS